MRILRSSSLVATCTLAAVVGGGVALAGGQVQPMWALLGVVPALLVLGFGLRQSLRRWQVARSPMPEEHRAWLRRHVPLYRSLDSGAREHFERDVQFILDEYTFQGVEGVEVTTPLRLGVAAGVAVLLHGRPSWELPGGRTVLLYPERFNDEYYESAGAAYDGMAHQQGPIILTAPVVEESWAAADGSNVVLHELAHRFDFDNLGADGVPSLIAPASTGDWQALVRNEMRRVRNGRSILRPYAAESPTEFFAVAVEAFFEQPQRMMTHHKELFAALVSFFHLDPRTGSRTASLDLSEDGLDDPQDATVHVTGPGEDADTSR